MKIVAVAILKNESDIVESMVRHNLAYVDHMVLIDNDSTDGSREILESLVRDQLPLDATTACGIGKYPSRQMTELMRERLERQQRCIQGQNHQIAELQKKNRELRDRIPRWRRAG